jgi:hypothetical protein
MIKTYIGVYVGASVQSKNPVFVVTSRIVPSAMMEEVLSQLLLDHSRVAIAGGPGSGKTTLASLVECRRVVHTDDWLHVGWSEVPGCVIDSLVGEDRFVVEGVQVPRVLRKGLEVDVIVWLGGSWSELTSGQRAIGAGSRTVLDGWLSGQPRFSKSRVRYRRDGTSLWVSE